MDRRERFQARGATIQCLTYCLGKNEKIISHITAYVVQGDRSVASPISRRRCEKRV